MVTSGTVGLSSQFLVVGLVRVARFRTSFLGRPRCCGRASACGANIVSRRKLLLQRQPE